MLEKNCFGEIVEKIKKNDELTLRAALLGCVLAILVCMYSAYAGLKIGGVYWPIVTTSLVSLAVLTVLGKTNAREIVVMQTAGSTGGLIAAGVIFTIPAIWMLGLRVSVFEITVAALVGGVAGVLFSIPLRKHLIETERLPFPDGQAAAALIQAGDEGGSKAKTLAASFAVGAAFSAARDYFKAIPGFVNLETLKIEAARFFSFGSSISLIPFAGGFLIGPIFTCAWFLGATASYFLLTPWFIANGVFSDKAVALAGFAKPIGVGIVIGAALAFFLLKGLPEFKKIFRDFTNADWGLPKRWAGAALIACVGALTVITEMNLALSIIAIAGAFAMAYVGARVTGEMNVDPMEIFALIVLIAAKIAFGFNIVPLVLLAAVVCIAAGMGGDFLQDLKAGAVLHANPRNQFKIQLLSVVAASLVIGVVLIALDKAQGIGSVNLPAPQAIAVKEIVSASALSNFLLTGLLFGALLTVFALRLGLGVIAVAFGIGMYVPIELSAPLFAGGLIRLVVDKARKTELWRLAAAGVISGEGLVGVVLALAGFAASSAGFIKF
ncbi:MAG: OPT/YSL family transporter [Candidatus Norongarragalinales archaeon]